jgi:hypothetical protein
MTPEQLRDGIFALNTRRFGTVAEIMIKKLRGLGRAQNMFHDLFDSARQQRVEVKFSRVAQNLQALNEHNLLECILREQATDRRIKFSDWQHHRFLCNIQQIKRQEFDVLYYGMFFDDEIKIFRIRPDQIDSTIGYGDRQHKGNLGEGQFHITEKTLQIHLDSFYHATLTYHELLTLLQGV